MPLSNGANVGLKDFYEAADDDNNESWDNKEGGGVREMSEEQSVSVIKLIEKDFSKESKKRNAR